MFEVKGGLSEEESSELSWSSTDEQIAEANTKFDRYARIIEDKNALVHRVETVGQTVKARLNARFADMKPESPFFFAEDKNSKSH